MSLIVQQHLLRGWRQHVQQHVEAEMVALAHADGGAEEDEPAHQDDRQGFGPVGRGVEHVARPDLPGGEERSSARDRGPTAKGRAWRRHPGTSRSLAKRLPFRRGTGGSAGRPRSRKAAWSTRRCTAIAILPQVLSCRMRRKVSAFGIMRCAPESADLLLRVAGCARPDPSAPAIGDVLVVDRLHRLDERLLVRPR